VGAVLGDDLHLWCRAEGSAAREGRGRSSAGKEGRGRSSAGGGGGVVLGAEGYGRSSCCLGLL
jgi:hypothetical protein